MTTTDTTSRTLTFDVFSALTDSRTGGADYLGALGRRRGWAVDGFAFYDQWDSRNKELHRLEPDWRPFRELSRIAFAAALASLGVAPGSRADSDIAADADGLLESMAEWPLWPDVTPAAFAALGDVRLGVLTNIDDELLASTAVVRLGIADPSLMLTSERLRSYKPAARFYRAAESVAGPFVHIASSARDVRGAGSAGLVTIRLARPGHPLDPDGLAPHATIGTLAELPAVLAEIR